MIAELQSNDDSLPTGFHRCNNELCYLLQDHWEMLAYTHPFAKYIKVVQLTAMGVMCCVVLHTRAEAISLLSCCFSCVTLMQEWHGMPKHKHKNYTQ